MSRRYQKALKDQTPTEKLARETENGPWGKRCNAQDPDSSWTCSLPKGHKHFDHLGCDGNITFKVWNECDAAIKEIEAGLKAHSEPKAQVKIDKDAFPRSPLTAHEKAACENWEKGDFCRVRCIEHGFFCTLPKGHMGRHVAATDSSVCCKPFYDPPSAEVEAT